MIGNCRIHGYAIVADDNCISGSDGRRPRAMRSTAERSRLHNVLDEAAVHVVGARAHRNAPNIGNRKRIVMTPAAGGVELRDDIWWWNWREMPAEMALQRAAPNGGVVVVAGGKPVYDVFLKLGYDEFHLARVRGATVQEGIALFTAVEQGHSPEEILSEQGLVPGPVEEIDPEKGVSVVVWRRESAT